MVSLLALSMLLGAERTVPIPLPGPGGVVPVAVEPETFDAVASPNETFIVWADQRRVEGLLTGTQVMVPSPELWVQGLDGGLPLRSWCQGVPVTSARMAITDGGRLGVAARHTDDTLTLAVFNLATRQFEGTSCGLTLGVTTSRPAIDAVGSDLAVVFERDGGLWSVTVPPPPATLTSARPVLLPGLCTQPVASGSVAGGLCPMGMGPIQLAFRTMAIVSPTEAASAFSLVPGTAGDGVVRVDAFGGVFLHQNGQNTVPVGQSVAGRQPLVAAPGGRPVVAFEMPDASTALWVSGVSTNVAGRPVGLALGSDRGIVMTQHSSGAVRGNDFVLSASASLVPPGESLAVARVLERRPSVAWWDEGQRWVVTWEEATAAAEWRPRAALVTAGGMLNVHAIPRLFEWPRVTRRPDGGLLGFGALGQRTVFFELDGGLQPGTHPATVRDIVPGAQAEFSWTDPDFSGNHLEYIDGLLTGPVPGAVTCAAATTGGFMVVGLLPDAGVVVDRLTVTGTRLGSGISIGTMATSGCVATRPGRETDVGLAYTTSAGVVFRQSGMVPEFTIPAPGASGLRLAALGSDGWLLVWRNSTGGVVGVALEPGTPSPAPFQLNVDAVMHGEPSVVAAPTGQVAVVWAAVYGDSVEGRLVLVSPTVPNPRPDGGVDGGLDGGDVVGDGGVGDGGVDDAGVGDGGVDDAGVEGLDAGGGRVVRFVPTCGCDSAPMSLVMVLAVLVARRWRRGG